MSTSLACKGSQEEVALETGDTFCGHGKLKLLFYIACRQLKCTGMAKRFSCFTTFMSKSQASQEHSSSFSTTRRSFCSKTRRRRNPRGRVEVPNNRQTLILVGRWCTRRGAGVCDISKYKEILVPHGKSQPVTTWKAQKASHREKSSHDAFFTSIRKVVAILYADLRIQICHQLVTTYAPVSFERSM